MFRKIHSNRDPKDTLLSQLKLEFLPMFERCSKTTSQKMKEHPKLIFYGMASLLLISAALSFTLTPKKQIKVAAPNISKGFDQLSRAAAAIRQTIRLKNEIDSLSTKPHLNARDSLALENDLDQLRKLQQP